MNTIGARVRAARRAAGLRIADVAEVAGISAPYLSQIELGRRTATVLTLEAIARAVDCTVHDLLGAPELTLRDADPLQAPRLDQLRPLNEPVLVRYHETAPQVWRSLPGDPDYTCEIRSHVLPTGQWSARLTLTGTQPWVSWGNQAVIHVIEGHVTAQWKNQTRPERDLAAGDSILLCTQEPYRLVAHPQCELVMMTMGPASGPGLEARVPE